MVQGQLGRGKVPVAELAGIAVAQQDILARKRARLLRDVPVGEQADHRRHTHTVGRGVHFLVVMLLGLRHTLQHQHQCATHSRHIDRLERGIQHQHRLLHHRRLLHRHCRCGATLGIRRCAQIYLWPWTQTTLGVCAHQVIPLLAKRPPSHRVQFIRCEAKLRRPSGWMALQAGVVMAPIGEPPWPR